MENIFARILKDNSGHLEAERKAVTEERKEEDRKAKRLWHADRMEFKEHLMAFKQDF
jgi:hypothetical protein